MTELVVPLFPLPNVVHFPGTPLPLHIFESRYRAMVADLLTLPEPERRVGIILAARDEAGDVELLEPGCVGRLVEHEPLPDGRSNIVLVGEFRFVVEREVDGRLYRRAAVRALDEFTFRADAERVAELGTELGRLIEQLALLSRPGPGGSGLDWRAFAPGGRVDDLVATTNQLAAALDLPPLRKQHLLGEPLLERAEKIAAILRSRAKLLTLLSPFSHLSRRPEWN